MGGEYLQDLHADNVKLKETIGNVQDLGGAYASSQYMTALNAAMTSFGADFGIIDEGLGSCQPMSDTIARHGAGVRRGDVGDADGHRGVVRSHVLAHVRHSTPLVRLRRRQRARARRRAKLVFQA